jgi:hypothetical protein
MLIFKSGSLRQTIAALASLHHVTAHRESMFTVTLYCNTPKKILLHHYFQYCMDSRLQNTSVQGFLMFIYAESAKEREKKRKKELLPAGVSKSVAHTVIIKQIYTSLFSKKQSITFHGFLSSTP